MVINTKSKTGNNDILQTFGKAMYREEIQSYTNNSIIRKNNNNNSDLKSVGTMSYSFLVKLLRVDNFVEMNLQRSRCMQQSSLYATCHCVSVHEYFIPFYTG